MITRVLFPKQLDTLEDDHEMWVWDRQKKLFVKKEISSLIDEAAKN